MGMGEQGVVRLTKGTDKRWDGVIWKKGTSAKGVVLLGMG